MYKPLQANEIMDHLDFEPKVLIDCGPGDGREWLVFKKFFPYIKLIGVEPSPGALAACKDLFQGRMFEAAVWSSKRKLKLYNPSSSLQSLLKVVQEKLPPDAAECDWPVMDEDPITVEAITIDWLLHECGIKGITSDVFLWADVKGAELPMLHGAKKALEDGVIRGINLEIHPWKEEPIKQFLESYGFKSVLRYADEGTHWDELFLEG